MVTNYLDPSNSSRRKQQRSRINSDQHIIVGKPNSFRNNLMANLGPGLVDPEVKIPSNPSRRSSRIYEGYFNALAAPSDKSGRSPSVNYGWMDNNTNPVVEDDNTKLSEP